MKHAFTQKTSPLLLALSFSLTIPAATHTQEILTPQDLINIQIQEHRGNTEPGKQIIDFNFSDLSGKFHTPITYRGNVLLLWMIGYINDTSVALAPEMEAMRLRHRDKPVTMLALDLWNGTHAQLTNFRTLTMVGMPLLLNALSEEFPFAVDSSTMVVVDKEGIVQGIFGSEDFAGIDRMVDLILDPAPVVEWGPRTLFFGSTTEVGAELTVRLTITNAGIEDLIVTGIRSDIAELTFSKTESTLSPRETEAIDVVFSPSSAGTVGGTITISTNDPTQQTVIVPVDPTVVEAGVPPLLSISSTTLSFGDVEVGKTGSAPLTIRNDGAGPLLVTDLQSDLNGVTFSQTTFTVPPNDSTTVAISISPDVQGDLAGSIRVFSNDPTHTIFPIAFQATAIIVPADPRADFDGSGTVDFLDFLEFAGAFGSTTTKYDLDDDGTVGFSDFLAFVGSFGKSVG